MESSDSFSAYMKQEQKGHADCSDIVIINKEKSAGGHKTVGAGADTIGPSGSVEPYAWR